jgi:hypothetical protein
MVSYANERWWGRLTYALIYVVGRIATFVLLSF